MNMPNYGIVKNNGKNKQGKKQRYTHEEQHTQ